MCIYLFCNFSERIHCKGNVKSMYSDYASGIDFLIKIQSLKSNKKGTNAYCLWDLHVLVYPAKPIPKCALTCIGVTAAIRVRLRRVPASICAVRMRKGDLALDESFCKVCFSACQYLWTALHKLWVWDVTFTSVHKREKERHPHSLSMVWLYETKASKNSFWSGMLYNLVTVMAFL